MTVSLMTFFNYLPYIILSLFVGTFVDNHSKKKIMLVSDSIAAICSLAIFCLNSGNALQIWHIYLVNMIIGFMGAFQDPASDVALGKVVPKEKLEQISGMNSFSDNLVAVLSPVFAAFLFAFGGLKLILIIDLSSFLFAFLILLFVLRIPDDIPQKAEKKSVFIGCKEGLQYLKQHNGIFLVIITMAVLNFFSRLTYENILSPMILSRSANDSVTLGIVNAVMGIGGIIGGIIVSSGKIKANSAKMIYLSAGRHYDGIGQKRNCLVSCWLSGKLTDSVYQCRADGNFISKCSRRYEGKNFCSKKCRSVQQYPLRNSAWRFIGGLCV